MNFENLKPINLSKINFINYPKHQYFSKPTDIYDKNQVVIHHTVSGPGIRGDMNTWLSTESRIATCIIIDRDGTPNQLFSSKYFGAHLGCGRFNLDKHSIGIELDNWGGLVKGDGSVMKIGSKKVKTTKGAFYACYGNEVDVPVTYYPKGFRGYKYYESYTEEQLRTVGELLLFWKDRYNISLEYNEDMWDVSQRALNGADGVWTHCSYRNASSKQDCHPQKEFKEMLLSLC